MKAIFRNLTSVAIVAAMVSLSGCATGDTAEAGNLTNALDHSAWSVSKWLSAADAPVVTGKIRGDNV